MKISGPKVHAASVAEVASVVARAEAVPLLEPAEIGQASRQLGRESRGGQLKATGVGTGAANAAHAMQARCDAERARAESLLVSQPMTLWAELKTTALPTAEKLRLASAIAASHPSECAYAISELDLALRSSVARLIVDADPSITCLLVKDAGLSDADSIALYERAASRDPESIQNYWPMPRLEDKPDVAERLFFTYVIGTASMRTFSGAAREYALRNKGPELSPRLEDFFRRSLAIDHFLSGAGAEPGQPWQAELSAFATDFPAFMSADFVVETLKQTSDPVTVGRVLAHKSAWQRVHYAQLTQAGSPHTADTARQAQSQSPSTLRAFFAFSRGLDLDLPRGASSDALLTALVKTPHWFFQGATLGDGSEQASAREVLREIALLAAVLPKDGGLAAGLQAQLQALVTQEPLSETRLTEVRDALVRFLDTHGPSMMMAQPFPFLYSVGVLKRAQAPFVLPPSLERLRRRADFIEKTFRPGTVVVPDLSRLIAEHANELPELLEASWATMPWDRVKSDSNALKILRHAICLKASGATVPASSLGVLAQVTGLPMALAATQVRYSENTMRALFSVMLELQGDAQAPILEGVVLAPEVMASKHLHGLPEMLQILRDVLALTTSTPEAARATCVQHLHNGPLTEDTISELAVVLRHARTAPFAELASSPGAELPSYDSVNATELRVGSLASLLTLGARYALDPSWQRTIPQLKTVARAVHEDSFFALKFSGDPLDPADQAQAAAQLAMLGTDAQRTAWTTPRSTVSIASDPNAVSPAERDRQARDVALQILDQSVRASLLLAHAPKLDSAAIPTALASTLDDLARPPKQTCAALLALGLPPLRVSELVLNAIENETDNNRMYRLGFVLRQWLRDTPAARPQNLDVAAVDALFMPLNAALTKPKEAPSPALLLSTINSDPLFLAEIGAFVGTSCQDYRTGGFAANVLGYVLDANTVALATVRIGAERFLTAADAARVSTAVASDAGVSVVFDGNRKIATFSLADGSKVSTLPLSDAGVSRRMLRVGTTADGLPQLIAENEYNLVEQAQDAVVAQQQALFDGLRADLGCTAKRDAPMTCAATRNVSGVYSDLGGGSVSGDYSFLAGVSTL